MSSSSDRVFATPQFLAPSRATPLVIRSARRVVRLAGQKIKKKGDEKLRFMIDAGLLRGISMRREEEELYVSTYRTCSLLIPTEENVVVKHSTIEPADLRRDLIGQMEQT
ncbi:hypothetical protein AC578_1856 [Pseudocercospora eumusae]|uniref:Uncharacterized protein n=1 Tax=Pseudocercospora eumusae TaxID=321146 RepID=A0A139HK52_9PEZI|nr:hypothetical protein AC578_1856 [Pseudocercospora eumusae]